MTPTTTAPPTRSDLHADNPHGWTRPPARLAAALGVLGGTVLFLDLGLHVFAPLGRSYFVIATLMALCLLGVPAAYWLQGLIANGWRRRVATVGTVITTVGVATWVVAFAMLFADPDAAFTQRLTPIGSLLMAVGMIVLGTTLFGSPHLSRRARVTPFLVGVYFPAQLVVQIAFFLGGKDEQAGPNGLLLGTWGLLWALAATTALLGRAVQPNSPSNYRSAYPRDGASGGPLDQQGTGAGAPRRLRHDRGGTRQHGRRQQ